MYDGADCQLVMLANLETLSKEIVALTLVPANVNPLRALQCDLCGKSHANGHCVPEEYIEEE